MLLTPDQEAIRDAVRAFAQERRHERRFAELNDENRQANMKTVHLNAA